MSVAYNKMLYGVFAQISVLLINKNRDHQVVWKSDENGTTWKVNLLELLIVLDIAYLYSPTKQF